MGSRQVMRWELDGVSGAVVVIDVIVRSRHQVWAIRRT